LAVLVAAAILGFALVGLADHVTVSSLIGDRDGFGLGFVEGTQRPTGTWGNFDMRGPDDPTFTDVLPVPAVSVADGSTFSYTHMYIPVPLGAITAARLVLFTLGIQDGDTQVANTNTDIRLFIDGSEVTGAFDTIDQFGHNGVGWAEYAQIVEVEIPQMAFSLLSDGLAEIRFESYSLIPGGQLEAFAIDYSELIIELDTSP
jgi:hypothetical protein